MFLVSLGKLQGFRSYVPGTHGKDQCVYIYIYIFFFFYCNRLEFA